MIIAPDIHGHLENLHFALEAAQEQHIVFLGDLIDRGPSSAEVVMTVRSLVEQKRATLLLGNHEEMALAGMKDFAYTDHWLRYGGQATCQSYFRHHRHLSGQALKADMQWIADHSHETRILEGVLLSHAMPPAWEDGQPLTRQHGEDGHIWHRPHVDLLHALPEGVQYSVHGHSIQPHPYKVTHDDGRASYFIDLGGNLKPPKTKYCVLDTTNRKVLFKHGGEIRLEDIPEKPPLVD